jgi:HlyD family secretion protein
LKRFGVLLFFLVLGLVAVSAFLLNDQVQRGKKEAEEKKKAQKVERGDILVQVIETGTLQAVKSVEVKSRVSGRVAELLVDEGDRVAIGQLVAVIDPQETQLQVAQNQAQVRGAESGRQRLDVEIAQRRVTAENALAKARSALRQLEAELQVQPGLTKSSIAAAESAASQAQQALDQLVRVTHPNARTATDLAVRDAELSLETAKNEAARSERLLERGYISRREQENAALQVQLATTRLKNAQENRDRLAFSQEIERKQAEERLRQAQSQLEQARLQGVQDTVKREQYLRAQREVSDAQAQLRDIQALAASRAQQSAQIDQLRSVLADGQRQLRETRVVAPISGIVTNRPVQVGELVSSLNSFSAGTTIFRIEDRATMVVKLQINEIDVARLREGMEATLIVDAFPDRTVRGKVSKIAPASSASGSQPIVGDAVVKYAVEVTILDPTDDLKSGMSAKCTMKIVDKKNVLRVPVDYVGKDDKGQFLMLAPEKKGQEPKRVSVVLGEKSGAFTEIVSGAKEGDSLVKPDFAGPKRKGMMQFGPDDEEQ